VCLLEFYTNYKQNKQQQELLEQYNTAISSKEDILNPGGIWRRMPMLEGKRSTTGFFSSKKPPTTPQSQQQQNALDDTVSINIFYQIGIPYVIAFFIISYLVYKFERSDQLEKEGPSQQSQKEPEFDGWYVLGYIMYATIESFGSLAVATFWSYTNSTLSLQDAEKYYGPIIATAQLGAIAGSTLVASGRWETSYLFIVVALLIILQLILMHLYDRRFQPTSIIAVEAAAAVASVAGALDDTQSVMTWQDNNATLTKPFWSGLYLIFQHGYVLLILGVSCLYEICMTLLDYQMKLLGYAKFDQQDAAFDEDGNNITTATMSFSKFMGRYGQVVNFTSLVFSSILFPWMIRRVGLRKTLLLFPTMLLIVIFLAYGALPGNLTVLFFSLSLLKALTYSVHDPSKEMLYIPTSNAIKFRAKFWIDVVAERIFKAIGSAFNTLANDVQQSIRIGSAPSFISAFGLWVACYYVGIHFDKLLATGKIVGLEYSIDPSTYSRVPRNERDADNAEDVHYSHYDNDEPSEVEIRFDEDNVSTLDLMADPVREAAERNSTQRTSNNQLELPSFIRI
jgi:ATP/ADP translocase